MPTFEINDLFEGCVDCDRARATCFRPIAVVKSFIVSAIVILSQETVLVESDELDNRRKALASALSVLNDRERRIFEARWLAENPITLKELADEFGVSGERVRQINVGLFEKVQKAVKNRVCAMETPKPLPAH